MDVVELLDVVDVVVDVVADVVVPLPVVEMGKVVVGDEDDAHMFTSSK